MRATASTSANRAASAIPKLMSARVYCAAIVVAVACFGCQQSVVPIDDAKGDAPEDAPEVDAAPSRLRVLFIGNSYTGVNDLPGMVARIAATSGTSPEITVDSWVE